MSDNNGSIIAWLHFRSVSVSINKKKKKKKKKNIFLIFVQNMDCGYAFKLQFTFWEKKGCKGVYISQTCQFYLLHKLIGGFPTITEDL